MSVQNALAGLEMVNNSLERGRTRQFEKDLTEIKQKYQTSERLGEQSFKAEESGKDRASRLQMEKIQQGPDWARINMAKEQQTREQAGRTAAAQTIAGSPEGQTPRGQLIAPLLESGAMAPAAAVSALPDRSSLEWVSQLNAAAWAAKSPEEATQYRSLADNAMKMYSDVKEQEAYRKRIADIKASGNNLMDYNYDPAPVMASARDLLSEKFEDYDPKDPLSKYFMDRKKKDPGFSRESVREELNAKLAAQIVKTDPKIGGDYLRAYQAASAIWEGFETGGIGSLLRPKELDEEGNPDGNSKGWRSIPLRIDKNLYFQSGSQASNPANNVSVPIFSGGQSPQAAAPQSVPTARLADSYTAGKQITTPVAAAGK